MHALVDLPFDLPLPPAGRTYCAVCGGCLRQPAGQTYVMQRQGYVKIGRSKHVQTRLKELHAIGRQRYIITPATMDLTEPLLLVGLIDGDVEHELHERFADRHVAGEWFLPDATMRGWLSGLASDAKRVYDGDIGVSDPVEGGQMNASSNRTWDDKRTRAQREADAEHRRVAILAVMAPFDAPDHPNAIANAARRTYGMPIYASLGRGGFRPGEGTAIAGVITSMEKRGLIRYNFRGRIDGLSGSAYCITDVGRDYLAAHREVLDSPWHDVPPVAVMTAGTSVEGIQR